MATSLPLAVDLDGVLHAHLSSAAHIIERGMSAALDGLVCGVGPRGHKLFLASANSPAHPDMTFSMPFPRGITVAALLATLLGDGLFDALWLLGMARVSANASDDAVLRNIKPLAEEMAKVLLDKVCAAQRALHEEERAKSSRKPLGIGAKQHLELALRANQPKLMPHPTTIAS